MKLDKKQPLYIYRFYLFEIWQGDFYILVEYVSGSFLFGAGHNGCNLSR